MLQALAGLGFVLALVRATGVGYLSRILQNLGLVFTLDAVQAISGEAAKSLWSAVVAVAARLLLLVGGLIDAVKGFPRPNRPAGYSRQ